VVIGPGMVIGLGGIGSGVVHWWWAGDDGHGGICCDW